METKCKHVDCLLHTCICVCIYIYICMCKCLYFSKKCTHSAPRTGRIHCMSFFRTSLATPNLCVYVFLPCIPMSLLFRSVVIFEYAIFFMFYYSLSYRLSFSIPFCANL